MVQRSRLPFWLVVLVLTVSGNVAVTSSTTTPRVVMPSDVLLVRGGAGFWGKLFFTSTPSPQKIYRQSLEEQVLLLDQQLRQAQEELIILRDQRKEALKQQKLARFVTSTKADRKAWQKEQMFLLQQKIDTTLIQLKQMERMKMELEELLAASNLRIQELQAKLAEQETLTKELEENYQQQIAAIQASLEETAAQQSAQFAAIQEERIRQAVEAARQEALLEVEEKIHQITKDLQTKHDKALQAEREKSIKAVEAEKKKMRKLVKALAIREKKLLAQAEKDRRNNNNSGQTSTIAEDLGMELDDDEHTEALESTSSVEVSGSSSFQQRPKTTPTTRGFI